MESRINVLVRMKPLKTSEKVNTKNHLWSVLNNNTINNIHTNESFVFDKVFEEDVSTSDIFENDVKKYVESAMKGINVTVFAYGQTCSGKTYTMLGKVGEEGKECDQEEQKE